MRLEKLGSNALRTLVLLAVLSLGAYVAFFRLGIGDWAVDEAIYSSVGLLYVSANDFSTNQEHPFLVKYILGVSQIVLGSEEAGAVRIPAATAALLTGLVLFAFARRVAGYWTGVLALALWTISPLVLVFGRKATLEIFLAFFATLALYLGWRWAETRSWWFAAFTGVALGLATASKIVGVLFLPAIPLVGLLNFLRGLRAGPPNLAKRCGTCSGREFGGKPRGRTVLAGDSEWCFGASFATRPEFAVRTTSGTRELIPDGAS